MSKIANWLNVLLLLRSVCSYVCNLYRDKNSVIQNSQHLAGSLAYPDVHAPDSLLFAKFSRDTPLMILFIRPLFIII